MISNKVVLDELDRFKKVARAYPEFEKTPDEDLFTLLCEWLFIKDTDEYDGLTLATEYTNYFSNRANDGGVDMIYPDVDESTMVFIQTKFSENIGVNEAVEEISKAMTTITDLDGNSDQLPRALKQVYSIAMDSMSEGDEIRKKILFVSGSTFDEDKARRRILKHKDSNDFDIIIISGEDIEDTILRLKETVKRVAYDKLSIQSAQKGYTEYESTTKRGVFTQVSARDLKRSYDDYQDKGLFDLNVRKYVRKKNIDDAIKHTIQKNSEEFWFMNNGLTIATSDFNVDGNTIKLNDFSIVNGAQTTTLIANTMKDNDEDFYVPVKIIMPVERLKPEKMEDFFNSISEATNSQKPINPQDLKANAREMVSMKKWLRDANIQLQIKRGVKPDKGTNLLTIKNDVLAQLIYSFVNQMPGTARSKKKSLFDTASIYREIFISPGYDTSDKRSFITDLIHLSDRFDRAADGLIKGEYDLKLSQEQLNAIKNGKLAMMGLFGSIYLVVNKIIPASDLHSHKESFKCQDFLYGSFWSDELDDKLPELIFDFAVQITELYEQNDRVTTVTNYLKTDKTFFDEIRPKTAVDLQKLAFRPNDKFSLFKIK